MSSEPQTPSAPEVKTDADVGLDVKSIVPANVGKPAEALGLRYGIIIVIVLLASLLLGYRYLTQGEIESDAKLLEYNQRIVDLSSNLTQLFGPSSSEPKSAPAPKLKIKSELLQQNPMEIMMQFVKLF